MNQRTLICPFEPELLSRLGGRRRAIDAGGDFDAVARLASGVPGDVEPEFLIVRSDLPLADVPLTEAWPKRPVVLFAPEMGPFIQLTRQLPLLRAMTLRIFLAGSAACTEVRILSSLGVACGLLLDGPADDFEALADLMEYAVYTRNSHGFIEPFHSIVSRYDPQRLTDPAAGSLDDPTRYLHLDSAGRVALTGRDLREGRFVADDVNALDDLENLPGYRARQDRWQQWFAENQPCARCEGWRVCGGRFRNADGSTPAGCGDFARDLLAAAEHFRRQQQTPPAPWQL